MSALFGSVFVLFVAVVAIAVFLHFVPFRFVDFRVGSGCACGDFYTCGHAAAAGSAG